MPALFDIRSDIQLLLSKSTQSKNWRVSLSQIEYKVHEKRARGMREEAHRNEEYIDPTWIQNMGRMKVTQVPSGDDPNVPQFCKEVGKVFIPQVVSFPEDRGVYRISSSSMKQPYYPIEPSRFWDIPTGNVRSRFGYYTRIGTAIYLRPVPVEINALLILDNPLDGYVLLTTDIESGNLTVGDVFEVISGSIVHNLVTYVAGSTFTAVNANFTGTGVVRYSLQKRKMTIYDPYPLSFTLTDYVIMKILTQDFKIEQSNIADIINDSKDQLLALQNEALK